MTRKPKRVFRCGQCRNNENALTHTYEEFPDGSLLPMCGYGWNRSDGEAFSIFREAHGTEGDCKLCQRNVRLNKPAHAFGFLHKTKWL